MAATSVAPTSWLLQIPGLPHDPMFKHVNAGVVLTAGIAIFSVLAYWRIKDKLEGNIVPSPKFSLLNFADVCIESVYGMLEGTLGAQTKRHFAFLASLFLFVWFGNLMGLIPFGGSPTGNPNTTIALGLASFVYYNWMGISEMGLKGYLAHFLMGLGPLGVFVAFFEILSHLLRPLTLAGRLFLNLEMDHVIVHTFEHIFAWFLPVPLLLFGIVVCTIQAFVFATLSSVYIQLATEHEHDHGPEHGLGHEHAHAHH